MLHFWMVGEIAIGIGEGMRAVATVPLIMAPLVGHEVIGMRLQLGADSRMVREIGIEPRMRCEEMRVVDEARVLAQLVRDLGMLIEVAVVKARDLAMRDPLTIAVLPSLMTPFVGHEAIGMRLQLGANSRMIREVGIEPRMRREEVRIIDQTRIMAE